LQRKIKRNGGGVDRSHGKKTADHRGSEGLGPNPCSGAATSFSFLGYAMGGSDIAPVAQPVCGMGPSGAGSNCCYSTCRQSNEEPTFACGACRVFPSRDAL